MSRRIRWSSLSNRNAGERLAQLGLADAGRAEEQERAGRPVRIRQARARAADRVGDRGDRLVLADHALVQLGFHLQQLVALALHQLGDRDAGGARHHLGDLLGADHACAAAAAAPCGALLLLPFACASFELLLELGQLAVLQLGDLVEVALALQLLDLRADAVDLFRARAPSPAPRPSRPSRSRRGRRSRAASLAISSSIRREALLRGLVLLPAHRFALDLQLDQPAVELVHRLGLGVDLDLDLAPRPRRSGRSPCRAGSGR